MSNIIQPQDKSPLFTLQLYRFLERYLLHSENKDGAPPSSIDAVDAEVIRALDNQENYVHIQYEELSTGELLKEPKVWWIKSWRTTYVKWQMDKERSAAERKEANLLVENTNRLMKAMAQQYGIADASIFRGIAHKIAKQKNDQIAGVHNIEIDKG